MPVFKQYFKIVKQLMPSVLIYGAIFLAITILMVFSSMSKDEKQFKKKEVPVYLINQDESNIFIDHFVKYLDAYVKYVELDGSFEKVQDALFYQEIESIITIPAGFTDNFIKGNDITLEKQSLPGSPLALSADTAINQYFSTARTYLQIDPTLTLEGLTKQMDQIKFEETVVRFDTKKSEDVLTSNGFNISYFNYLAYIMLACFIGVVSTVMHSFHALDIRRRHNASPISSHSFNFQLVFANLAFVMCYMLVFILASWIFNSNRTMNMNTILTWISSLLFAFTALAISYLIGITVNGKAAVSTLSTVVSLSLSFLSGVFVPQDYLGDTVLKLASFTPTYWYVKANNTIGYMTDFHLDTMKNILGYYGIQVGFGLAILSIALVVSKQKRQAVA